MGPWVGAFCWLNWPYELPIKMAERLNPIRWHPPYIKSAPKRSGLMMFDANIAYSCWAGWDGGEVNQQDPQRPRKTMALTLSSGGWSAVAYSACTSSGSRSTSHYPWPMAEAEEYPVLRWLWNHRIFWTRWPLENLRPSNWGAVKQGFGWGIWVRNETGTDIAVGQTNCNILPPGFLSTLWPQPGSKGQGAGISQ